jgi:hypothetical protein
LWKVFTRTLYVNRWTSRRSCRISSWLDPTGVPVDIIALKLHEAQEQCATLDRIHFPDIAWSSPWDATKFGDTGAFEEQTVMADFF